MSALASLRRHGAQQKPDSGETGSLGYFNGSSLAPDPGWLYQPAIFAVRLERLAASDRVRLEFIEDVASFCYCTLG